MALLLWPLLCVVGQASAQITSRQSLEAVAGPLASLYEFGPRAVKNTVPAVPDAILVGAHSTSGADSTDKGAVALSALGQITLSHGITGQSGRANEWTLLVDLRYIVQTYDVEAKNPIMLCNQDNGSSAGLNLYVETSNDTGRLGADLHGYGYVELRNATFYRMVVTANLTGNNSGMAYFWNGVLVHEVAGGQCGGCQPDGVFGLDPSVVLLPGARVAGTPREVTTVAFWPTALSPQVVAMLGPPGFGAADSVQCAGMDVTGAVIFRGPLPPAASSPSPLNVCGAYCCRGSGVLPCWSQDFRYSLDSSGRCKLNADIEVCAALSPDTIYTLASNQPDSRGIVCTPDPSSPLPTSQPSIVMALPWTGASYLTAASEALLFFAAFWSFQVGLWDRIPRYGFVVPSVYLMQDYKLKSVDDHEMARLQAFLIEFTAATAEFNEAANESFTTILTDEDYGPWVRGPSRPPAPVAVIVPAGRFVCNAAGHAVDLGSPAFFMSTGCPPLPDGPRWPRLRTVGAGFRAHCDQWKTLFRKLHLRSIGILYMSDVLGVDGQPSSMYSDLFSLVLADDACLPACDFSATKPDTIDGTCLKVIAEVCRSDATKQGGNLVGCLPPREALEKMRGSGEEPNDVRAIVVGFEAQQADFEALLREAVTQDMVGADYTWLFMAGTSPHRREPAISLMQNIPAFGSTFNRSLLLAHSCGGPRWETFTHFIGADLVKADYPPDATILAKDLSIHNSVGFGVNFNPDTTAGQVHAFGDGPGKVVDPRLALTVEATWAVLATFLQLREQYGLSVQGLTALALEIQMQKTTFLSFCGTGMTKWSLWDRATAIPLKVFSLTPTGPTTFNPVYLGEVTEDAANFVREPIFSNGLSQPALQVPPYCGAGEEPAHNLTCVKCPVGWNTAKPGRYRLCTPCSAGSFARTSGSVNCTSCRPGYFSSGSGSSQCSPCAAGTFQPGAGQTECFSCAAGSFASAGSPDCERCAQGWYQPTRGSGACLPCPAGLITATSGSTSWTECLCPPEAYIAMGDSPETAICVPCEEGLRCGGGLEQPVQLAGYWGEVDRRDGVTLLLFRCASKAFCPEGPPGSCAYGRVARACDNCAAGFYPGGGGAGSCKSCADSASPFVQAVIIAGAVIVCLTALAVYAVRGENAVPRYLLSLSTCCQTTLMSLQCLAAYSGLDIEWVGPLAAFRPVFDFFQVRSDFIEPSCLFRVGSATGHYLTSVLIVPAALAYVVLVHAVIKYCFRAATATFDHLCNMVGLLVMITYTPMSLLAFAPLRCVMNPSGVSTVMRYRSVLCWTSREHITMLSFSALTIVLFPCSFLAVVIGAVWVFPSKLGAEGGVEFLLRFNFLFQRIRGSRYYFVIIVVFRGFVFSVIPAVILGEVVVHLLVLQLATVAYFAGTTLWFPWRSELANTLDQGLGAILVLTATVGAALSNYPAQAQRVAEVTEWCALAFGAALFVVSLAVSILQRFISQKRYAAFLSHHKAGAAAFSRFLKVALTDAALGRVFLDCDELDDLDTLLDIVSQDTKVLVAIHTPDYLKRMWCAIEIVAAVRSKVPIVPIFCEDYAPITDAELDRLQDIWTLQELAQMGMIGCLLADVRSSYEALRVLKPVSFDRLRPLSDQLVCIDELASRIRAFNLIPISMQLARSRRGGSSSVVTAKVLVTGLVTDQESVFTCYLLQRLLQMELVTPVYTVTSAQAVTSASSATYLVVVLRPGLLESATFADVLMQSDALEFVPVLASKHFTFPTSDFYESILQGKVFGGLVSDATRVVQLYKAVFTVLSRSFTPEGSASMIGAEITLLAKRFNINASRSNTVRTSSTSLEAVDDEDDGDFVGQGVVTEVV